MRIIDAQLAATEGDFALREGSVGGEERNAVGGAFFDGVAHGNNKVGAAVGIDEMVARVVRHEHVLQALAFGNAGGDA